MANKDQEFDNSMVSYLTLIQEPISRMSTTASVIKGFAAAVIVGMCSIIGDADLQVLIFCFIPILCFTLLDAFYLGMERKFKYLFEQVRTGEHPVDFQLHIELNKKQQKAAKSRLRDCIKSKSIWPFYLCLIIVGGLLIGNKAMMMTNAENKPLRVVVENCEGCLQTTRESAPESTLSTVMPEAKSMDETENNMKAGLLLPELTPFLINTESPLPSSTPSASASSLD